MTAVPFHQDPRVVQGYQFFSRAVGVLMCVVALALLADWWWNLPRLARSVPGELWNSVSTAIGFGLSGSSLLLSHTERGWRARFAALLSMIVLGMGAVELIEYVAAAGLGINLWSDSSAACLSCLPPRRMVGFAGVAFVLLGGVGLLVSVRRWLWLRETLAIALLAIAMTGLASHGLAWEGIDDSTFSRVPIPTALLLVLATLGWLSVTPTVGLTRVTTAATLGGAFSRRVLLPALLLPVAFTYAFELFQSWLGLPNVMAFSLMAVVSGSAVAWLIWWVALLLDKLERQRMEATQLRTDADTDTLTGLANRRAFDDTLDSLLQGHREHDTVFSLLMLDLDKFKSYNDSFGHLAGDEVLRITGRLLAAAVRPSDVAARYGGEEFSLLLPATDVAKANEVAQRVLDAFRNFAWPRRLVSISIGVAQSAPGDDAAAVIKRADTALYEAKNTGRDRAVMAATASSAPPAP
ncbi:GGDEF domain-containing protein [Rhodanobacter sp. AS-Z3]|uniref:GGDEF domain-containing protein n=1 Tax=Rhodanobacter sp. AS-Z3 TaxID=3031330 RepID=UPI00247849B6|nr:GGDEF domain-containing protein [Rhodanobacter sp. AS-Z3]WEN14506.1 GGDEF domain-containing protein [Rhodanobacter sp. AS-Z3]